MTATRRLAAIMAVDVVGYSRLMGDDETGTARAVREHREEAQPIVAGLSGRIVKTMGDGLLLEFPSVVVAVECAVAIQQLMVERNADVPEAKQIVYRIGVNLGDVLIEGDDILGDGVNIAARLEGICEPGGVLISSTAHEHVRGKIEADFVDLGEKNLKNIALPVRAYAVATAARTAASAPSAAPARKRGPPRFSIVVLPFANMSSDPEQQYFADGVTENLTTDLSRLQGSFVIARNTAFTYKGKAVDAKQVGEELGVRYVLEGSVQRAGTRVRVNAQLIDAETGAHLWADRFQEEVADLFKLQDDVVARLANALRYELPRAEAKSASRSRNPDAVDLSLRAWVATFSWRQKPATADEVAAVRALFERALELDPNDADALAGFAYIHFGDYAVGQTHPEIDYDAEILDRADRSIAFARDNSTAYVVKSMYLSLSRRPGDALRVANAGLAVNSNNANLFAARAVARNYLGQFEQAKSDLQEAMRSSPRDPNMGNWHNLVADAELGLGRLDSAIDECSKAIDAGFRTWFSYLNLAAARALKGNIDEAKTALAEARRLNPKLSVKWLTERKPILQPAFEALRKAGMPEQ